MAMIACVDLDPFLVRMVQRVRPDDVVVAMEPDALTGARLRRVSAAVVGAGSEGLPSLAGSRLAARTVVVTGQEDGWSAPGHSGPVIRRPVGVVELRQALAQALPPRGLSALRSHVRALVTASPTGVGFAAARVGAVVAASGLALTDTSATPPAGLVISLLTWVFARTWVRQASPPLIVVDMVLAAGAIVLSGGTTSPFLVFAAVVAAEVGYAFTSWIRAILVLAAMLGGLVPTAVALRQGEATGADLIGWGVLLPLSTVVGALARRIHRGRNQGSFQQLSDLHATLDRLSRQAQGAAGTLELDSVVEQIFVHVRDEVGAVGGLLLLGDAEVHDVVGGFGLVGPPPLRVVVPAETRARDLPDQLTGLLPAGNIMTARLRGMGVDRGAIIVVVPSGVPARERRDALVEQAAEAAVAIDNVRLFEGIRGLTIDAERRRLARDLHDGVVQSLVHVRFELDLVRRVLDIPHAEEIERLRQVVGQAVDEVRATVNDLRSVRLSAGLGTALLSVAREYERPGLRVVVDAEPVEALSPEAELQLLRIAQEAISNAVHHGESSVVFIRLWEDDRHAHLQVLDDGVGVDTDHVDPSRGVGLRAMKERADLLGAALDLGPGADGGTCVQVDVPLGRVSP